MAKDTGISVEKSQATAFEVSRVNKIGKDRVSDGVGSGHLALDGKSLAVRDHVALGPILHELKSQAI